MSPRRISVLIVNFNSTQLLRECLGAVFSSTCAEDLEVIVVDNASADFPLTALKAQFGAVLWLPQLTNTTFTGGCNLAFEQATGDTVLLLNPDTRVQPTAIEQAARHLERRPNLVAVGAHFVAANGTFQRGYYRRLPKFRDVPVLLFEPIFKGTRRGRRFLMSDEPFDRETVVEHVAAAFVMIRRTALSDGLMDPGYFNLLSDLDLSRRLAKVGQIAVFPDVRCFHLGGGAGIGTADIDLRLRLYHDFTWGLRRYFGSELRAIQKAILELELSMYWLSRVGRILLITPRAAWKSIWIGASALAGRAPRYRGSPRLSSLP